MGHSPTNIHALSFEVNEIAIKLVGTCLQDQGFTCTKINMVWEQFVVFFFFSFFFKRINMCSYNPAMFWKLSALRTIMNVSECRLIAMMIY